MHFRNVWVMQLSYFFAYWIIIQLQIHLISGESGRFVLRYVGVDFLAAGILVLRSLSPEVLQLKDAFWGMSANQVLKYEVAMKRKACVTRGSVECKNICLVDASNGHVYLKWQFKERRRLLLFYRKAVNNIPKPETYSRNFIRPWGKFEFTCLGVPGVESSINLN